VVTRWKIWYLDGSTFSSEDGKPEAAPDGIEVIAERRDGRTLLHTGGEHYRWDGNGWSAVPILPDIKKSGRLMKVEDFKVLKALALKWLSMLAS